MRVVAIRIPGTVGHRYFRYDFLRSIGQTITYPRGND